MAEERPAEAARRRPAIELEAGYNDAGWHYANIRIDSPYLAAGILGVVTLGALYYRNPEGVETVVSNAFRGIVDSVLGVRPGSVLVDLRFDTKERFLAFMDAFVTGIVKQRLQEEFSKIGVKGELEVTVTVYDNASRER